MKTDPETIRDECREIGTLLRAFEASAVQARTHADDGGRHAALAEVERQRVAIVQALDRALRLAARRDAAHPAGIPDPVQDLDQSPQD